MDYASLRRLIVPLVAAAVVAAMSSLPPRPARANEAITLPAARIGQHVFNAFERHTEAFYCPVDRSVLLTGSSLVSDGRLRMGFSWLDVEGTPPFPCAVTRLDGLQGLVDFDLPRLGDRRLSAAYLTFRPDTAESVRPEVCDTTNLLIGTPQRAWPAMTPFRLLPIYALGESTHRTFYVPAPGVVGWHIDVTAIVRSWLEDGRPNHGFLFSPDIPPLSGNRSTQCRFVYRDLRLHLAFEPDSIGTVGGIGLPLPSRVPDVPSR
jgi:hypothetical protein